MVDAQEKTMQPEVNTIHTPTGVRYQWQVHAYVSRATFGSPDEARADGRRFIAQNNF